MAVTLVTPAGEFVGKIGRKAHVLGDVIPSRDDVEARRWEFTDRNGLLIPRHQWPSARALRGEVDTTGLIGIYRRDGEHLFRVISIPLPERNSDFAAISFIQQLDAPTSSELRSLEDLQHRLIDKLVEAVVGSLPRQR